MIENVTVVVFLPLGDFALFRVTRVPETGVVELPSDAGRTCALNGVGQQLSARNVDHVQRAQLRAAGRGAISEQLSIVRGLPPIKRDSAVGSERVHVHQFTIGSVDGIANVKNRLVLCALAAGVKNPLSADLGRADVAEFEQLS